MLIKLNNEENMIQKNSKAMQILVITPLNITKTELTFILNYLTSKFF